MNKAAEKLITKMTTTDGLRLQRNVCICLNVKRLKKKIWNLHTRAQKQKQKTYILYILHAYIIKSLHLHTLLYNTIMYIFHRHLKCSLFGEDLSSIFASWVASEPKRSTWKHGKNPPSGWFSHGMWLMSWMWTALGLHKCYRLVGAGSRERSLMEVPGLFSWTRTFWTFTKHHSNLGSLWYNIFIQQLHLHI